MNIYWSFMSNGYVQLVCTFLGSFAMSGFLPSPSLPLFVGGVCLFCSIWAYRPIYNVANIITQALQFRKARDMSAIYGCGLALGAIAEYANRYAF